MDWIFLQLTLEVALSTPTLHSSFVEPYYRVFPKDHVGLGLDMHRFAETRSSSNCMTRSDGVTELPLEHSPAVRSSGGTLLQKSQTTNRVHPARLMVSVMDENSRPVIPGPTAQSTITTASTTTAAPSITTIKQEDDANSLSFTDLHGSMEVYFEDLLEESSSEEEGVVVVKFGPHHRTMSNPNGDSRFERKYTRSRARKRQKTTTGRADTSSAMMTATDLDPKTAKQLRLVQIFSSNSPHAQNDVHTHPLLPHQPHQHSYHTPLLLSFPGSAMSSSGQDSIAAAQKHRDALLAWFDKSSAARQMPWQKPWVDTRPLLCPADYVLPASTATTTASVVTSKPTTSSSKPMSTPPVVVAPKVEPLLSTLPDSVLMFPKLAASILRAKAEAKAKEQQAQVKAEAEAKARVRAQVKVEAETTPLPNLHTAVSQRFYEILLAEVLRQALNQANYEEMMKDVSSHYNQWIAAFPTMQDLAKASEKQVEELLDHKNTARLHVAALQLCCTEYNSPVGLPTTVDELQKLPGIGPTTAGLVASVVFGRPEPMVNWNIIRVLCRQLGIRANANTKDTREVIWEAAKRLVEQVAWDGVETEAEETVKKLGDKKGKQKAANKGGGKAADIYMVRENRGQPPLSDRPGRWGQALAELGGTICLQAPEKPKCELCPIQATCRAYAEGLEIAREKGLMEGRQQGNNEKEVQEARKRKVVDIEDAACTLCPPPPPPLTPSRPLSDAHANITKLETQDGTPANPIKLEIKDEEDPEVQFLACLPLYPLGENSRTTQTATTGNIQNAPTLTQHTTQMYGDENTITATFYEENDWLKARVDEASRGELKPKTFAEFAAREFVNSYCGQYPYTKPRRRQAA